ncbi:MAG: PaaI family thioesterase [Ruminococcaceae bacterium]|nr:PaaI family thioesterase [Oscillospiraceae bacterium]
MSQASHLASDLSRIINRSGQFAYENGITVTDARPGYAEGVLEVRPTSSNPHGTVHGGCLYTLADTVAGTAACAHGASCVTVSGTMEFLRPATGPTIRCVATPKKQGRTLSVMQVVLTDDAGKNVATGTFTFFMSQPEKQ